MAQKRRKAPVPTKPRFGGTLARMLLIIGYGILFAFLGSIFLMRQELQRVGVFGDKPAAPAPVPRAARPPQVVPEPQRPTITPPSQVTTEGQRTAPAAPPQVMRDAPRQAQTSPTSPSPPARRPGEITADEKQALDDILRSKR